MEDAGRIRWATLGSSQFLQGWSFPEIDKSESGHLVAVGSRTRERAEELGRKLGVSRIHASYSAVVNDPEVDVVYVALPNHMHAKWSLEALRAGKHVLCEKPLTGSSKASRQLLAEASELEPFLFEGYMWRQHDQWKIARAIIRSGRLGDITLGRMHYCYNDDDPASTRNNPRFGGGALRMIGCYPISMFEYLFDRGWPTSVLAYVDYDPDFGVDRLTEAVLDFGGCVGQMSVSTQLWDEQTLTVYGKKGWLRLETPVTPAADQSPVITIEDENGRETIDVPAQSQFAQQVDFVCTSIRSGDRPSLDNGVKVLDVLEAIVRSGRRKGSWTSVELTD